MKRGGGLERVTKADQEGRMDGDGDVSEQLGSEMWRG